MRTAIKNFLLITIPTIGVFLFILELVFRFIIPASEAPLRYFDTQNSMYISCPNQRGLYTIGKFAQQRGRWRVNNYGWNSPVDYQGKKQKIRIAAIGDSFTEALQVDFDKNFSSLLQNRLGNAYEVYQFGISGAPFSQYVYIDRYVNRIFDPDIVIFNLVHNDFDESILKYRPSSKHFLTLSVSGSNVIENKPAPNKNFQEFIFWKRFAAHDCALTRYLLMNLGLENTYRRAVSYRKNIKYEENVDVNLLLQRKKDIESATKYLVETIKAENKNRDIVFIFDAPRQSIYENKLEESKSLWLHSFLRGVCESNGIYFLDLTEPMSAEYQKNHKMFNSAFDSHWDNYGHQFVAGNLYKFLLDNKIIKGK